MTHTTVDQRISRTADYFNKAASIVDDLRASGFDANETAMILVAAALAVHRLHNHNKPSTTTVTIDETADWYRAALLELDSHIDSRLGQNSAAH